MQENEEKKVADESQFDGDIRLNLWHFLQRKSAPLLFWQIFNLNFSIIGKL